MSKKVILQSGFVSKNSDDLIIPNQYDHNYIDNILVKNFKHESNNFFYSKNISDLYNQYRSDNSLGKNFDFRKRVYQAAKKAFKTDSFYDWLQLQIEYAPLTQLHKLFLYDTFSFITSMDLDGYSREVQPEQYINLIQHLPETSSVKFNIDHFFNKSERSDIELIPKGLTEVIQMWLSKPKGFGDLLVTLFVIFGDRPYIVDVRHNPVNQ